MLNFELSARRFLEATGDATLRLNIVTEIRDNLEIVHTAEYPAFLKYLFPVFYNVLRQGQPQFNDGVDQKIRNVILEILNRLPNNGDLRQYVPNLLKLAMFLLEVENEENAVICLRVIIDLHKNYRPALENDVQAFFDIVQKMYSELPKTVQQTFKDKPPSAPANAPVANAMTSTPSAISETSKPTNLIASTSSFKVLTECPIIVVLLFNLYNKFLHSNINKFMPLVVQALSLQAPPSARATHHALYVDFIAAQVKTLSFLAYMLKSQPDHSKEYQPSIPKSVIQLLMNCPNESAAIRKELLIATRHILATDFRIGFITHIDTLLDEKVLIGSGRTSFETLRPLAYSTLADLVHHVRADLSLQQLSKVVLLYTRNLHDKSLPFSIQTMSVKLLLHFVEFIPKKHDPGDGGKARYLLIKILDAIVNKFGSLRKQMPGIMNQPSADQETGDVPWTDNIKAKVMNVEESLIFCRLLKNGLKCFSIFHGAPTDEKEILEHFASVFTMVAQPIFQDVFSLHISFLFDCMCENQAILTIAQHFLAYSGLSRMFAEVLLSFLMDRLKTLSGNDKVASSVLLKLFKLVFGSVALINENEIVLQPHVATIVTSAMKYAAEVKDSSSYFVLLRALFRSIGAGNNMKFDIFMKEFLPLLPGLLEGLNRLNNSSHPQPMRDLFVELALTVPVRLSHLLPCLPYWIKPLLLALESNNENAVIGLRTLDTMIDNVSRDFLDACTADVRVELMKAVWRHLRSPYPNGHVAIRILGKLSGRCRQPVVFTPPMSSDEAASDGLNTVISFEPPTISTPLALGSAIALARKTLSYSNDTVAQKQAFSFLRACLMMMMAPAGMMDIPRVTAAASKENDSSEDLPTAESITDEMLITMRDRLVSESAACKNLLECAIIATSNDKLKPESQKFYEHVCRHFAIVFATHVESDNTNELDPFIIAHAFTSMLTIDNRSYTKTVLDGIDMLLENLNMLRGPKEPPHQVFNVIAQLVAHSCYQREWHIKSGGCLGISHLSNKMPPTWVREHELRFVKAIIFLFKDMAPEISVTTIEEAAQTLLLVLKVCNSHSETSEGDEQQHKVLNEVISSLASELFTPHALVRRNIQAALEQLAVLTGSEITELLEPFRASLITPIYTKPLRSQPIHVQIGNLEALTFCLNLRPPLLEFSKDLLTLLQSTLEVAEMEDPAPKIPSHKQYMHFTNLRIVSIELMSAAMACSEFQNPENQEFRNNIIGMFFKALTFRSKEIVGVAKKGLAQVIAQHKLPKELLQSSLRPILLTLQDHRKLSVSLLQGLARLLELLTNCFNVALGEKLLELLTKWTTEPAKREETKVACGILEIFHLLPVAAIKF